MNLQDTTLVATTPEQMLEEQKKLVIWAEVQLRTCITELREAVLAHRKAKQNKWDTSALKRLVKSIRERCWYYLKLQGAFRLGYQLVPSTLVQDCDIIAVRRGTRRPRRRSQIIRWKGHSFDGANPGRLAPGKGEYLSPLPVVSHEKIKDGDKEKFIRRYGEYSPAVEIPSSLVKTELMDVTKAALSRKLFDAVGISPSQRKKGDPVLFGVVCKPNRQTGNWWNPSNFVTFALGWYVNTRDLRV